MNNFAYAFTGRKGGYAPKWTVAYSQWDSVKNFDFLAYAIGEWPLNKRDLMQINLQNFGGAP